MLVWDLDLMGGEPRTLSARSELAGVGPVILAVAIGAGVAVVVLAAVAVRGRPCVPAAGSRTRDGTRVFDLRADR